MRTITVNQEIDDTLVFETLDEAIAEAMAQLDPGGVLSIHEADCEHDGEDEDSCSCTPLEMVVGAEA